VTAAVLGLDLGTSGARAAVIDVDGRLLGTGRRATRTEFGPRRAEQDPDEWVDAVLAAGREALAIAGVQRVAAVGVAALGPAPVLLDESYRPLGPAPLFALDTRAEPERRALAGEAGLADDAVTHDHALPKLLRVRDHEPDRFARAVLALDVAGYLVLALTGQPAMDSITAAEFALPGHPSPLPVPAPTDPLAIAGRLTREAAGALGLTGSAPVTTGCYDTYADVAACGVRAPGDAALVLGSTAITCAAVGGPVGVPGLECVPYPGAGMLLGGWTTTAGAALRWAAALLDRAEPALAAEAAALLPGSGGLIALPYLAGERTPVRDPDARGLLLGLTLGTRPVQVYRAMVDAVALAIRHHVDVLRAAAISPARFRLGGGGARNAAWLGATADAVALPLDVVPHAGEAIGPCDLALRAAGIAPVDRVERTIEPAAERAARFDALFALYTDLHPRLADAMHALHRLDDPEAPPA
jgi:xylulokinase